MKTKDEMVRLNKTQASFYDEIQRAAAKKGGRGYATNTQANLTTRIWASLRERQQAATRKAGASEAGFNLMREWISQKSGGRALELGCFSGSPMTFHLIRSAGEYVGIELSGEAVDVLNREIAHQGLSRTARAVRGDFLELDDPAGFDVVYAHGVLHHFENPKPLFEHLAGVLKPGGILVFSEVSAVNPWHRAARRCYRPFQSDAAWEWPFTPNTVAALEDHFQIEEAIGWGRYTLPLSVLVGVPIMSLVVDPLYQRLIRSELNDRSLRNVWLNSVVCAKCVLRQPRGGTWPL